MAAAVALGAHVEHNILTESMVYVLYCHVGAVAADAEHAWSAHLRGDLLQVRAWRYAFPYARPMAACIPVCAPVRLVDMSNAAAARGLCCRRGAGQCDVCVCVCVCVCLCFVCVCVCVCVCSVCVFVCVCA